MYSFLFLGVLAVGLFAQDPVPLGTTYGRRGLFRGIFFIMGFSFLTKFYVRWRLVPARNPGPYVFMPHHMEHDYILRTLVVHK